MNKIQHRELTELIIQNCSVIAKWTTYSTSCVTYWQSYLNFRIPRVDFEHDGTYTCQVTDRFGQTSARATGTIYVTGGRKLCLLELNLLYCAYFVHISWTQCSIFVLNKLHLDITFQNIVTKSLNTCLSLHVCKHV